MDGTDYQLLKRNLPLDVAIEWLTQDCKDDFYPDPLNFSDIKTYPEEYLRNREHRILQIHTLPYRREYVPKKSGMLREAIWLHPSHRILYLAILRHLLGKLDSKLLPVVYSYRLDEPDDLDKYPFNKSRERWKLFNNDFREAALDPSTEAVLITDLVSFFDHINCNQLCNRILSMLGTSKDQIDEAVIGLLNQLLNMWSHEGDGIPQNYDPSSFFGSLYLHNVDNEMVTRRYKYFRWADDIRIVAKSERQALRALHDLQTALRPYKLYLATEKTDIIPKDDPRFKKLLDVEDERRISKAEEILMSGDCAAIRSILDQLFERLAFHSGPNGDEKKLRALANRLLDAADYTELRPLIHPRLQEFVIPRFESHPERCDRWMKILSSSPNDKVAEVITKSLIEMPSIFDWERFYLWKLSLYLPNPPASLMEKAILLCGNEVSDSVAAQGVIFVGRHGNNTQREALFCNHFTTHNSYLIQRAVLVAIQELPTDQREYFFGKALEVNSDHKELVDYLLNLQEPNYGIKKRTERQCIEEPRRVEVRMERGVGLVNGEVVRFRLSKRDYEYE